MAAAKDFDAIKDPACFGFYRATDKRVKSICDTCALSQPCRMVMVTDGMRAMVGLIKYRLALLPSGEYPDTNSVVDLVRVLLDGPDGLTPPGPQVRATDDIVLEDF